MDSISLILTALATGAAPDKDVPSDGMKDAYNGLKKQVERHFAGKHLPQLVLEEYEKDPATWEKPLRKVLQESGVRDDTEAIQSARHLLELVQHAQYSDRSLVAQTTNHVQRQIIGDKGRRKVIYGGES